MYIKKLGMAFVALLVFGATLAKTSVQLRDSLWHSFINIENAPTQINVLFKIADIYLAEGKNYAKDSIVAVAANRFLKDNNLEAEAVLVEHYFNNLEYVNVDSGNALINRLYKLESDMQPKAGMQSVMLYRTILLFLNKKPDSACAMVSKLIAENKLPDRVLTECYLALGSFEINTENKSACFQNLTNALLTAQKLNENYLVYLCNAKLIEFYEQIENWEMALYYNYRQHDILQSQKASDSVDLSKCFIDRAAIYANQGNFEGCRAIFWQQILFLEQTGLIARKTALFSIYRTFLVRNGFFKELHKLYIEHFPIEYTKMRQNDPCQFYRVTAFMKEGINAFDSAEFYFKKTEECILESGKDNAFLSNFYKRYGEFKLRRGDFAGSEKYFKTALNFAQTAKYLPYLVELCHYLDSTYALKKDFGNAYLYSRLNKIYSDSLALINKNSKLIQLEINNEERQIRLAAQQEKEQLRVRHRNQLLIVGVILFFSVIIILSVLYNYSIQKRLLRLLKKEKQRSDDLLLNILPMQVAQELKDKGNADAQYFDPVTVMFTDFKGFTKVSEILTAAELVNELHVCFSRFDEIMKKYGIEKIKTVGDAYLAVAGLPIPDPDHANKVVLAALEIADFMKARHNNLQQRSFEVRIGVHSGGVVAGIVGVTKFAYDIWGDTVNVAARMEQNSEPGMVNISENTYQLVKNNFDCINRGKLIAKNKGELNMYFVEKLKH